MQHTVIRRVRLREELRPIRVLVESEAAEMEWLLIMHVTDPSRAMESFDLVFLRAVGTAFPWMGYETLRIAMGQAHALVRVEYVEWDPCKIELANADRSISWERALPSPEPASTMNR